MMRRREESAPDTPQLPISRPRRRDAGVIETVLLASTACLLAAVAWPIARQGLADAPAVEPSVPASPAAAEPTPRLAAGEGATIQLVLLLDTSSSMDGLIQQARSRLWSVVNALDSATFHGGRPRLEVAVYEYGNDRLGGEDGHIRQVVGFTNELDRVSQALFGLSTLGGSEFAGAAIDRATTELAWRTGPGVMRVMYIAGNESFDQGTVPWSSAIDRARELGVVVNTVLCASPDSYDADLWRSAAARAGGRFFAIDQDQQLVHRPSPYDAEIGQLGTAINTTYVAYGSEGSRGLANQRQQDENNMSDGEGSIQRSFSKGSKNYANPSWDLVDGLRSGTIALDELQQGELPEALRGLSAPEIAAFVGARQAEREAISARLAELRAERDRWQLEHTDGRQDAGGLDAAMLESLVEQARVAGFTLSGR